MMRRTLQFLLRVMAARVLIKYRPDIIAITGSIGKSTVREATRFVLSEKFSVYATARNYNTEIGVPLTILGIENAPKSSFAGWVGVFMKALNLLVHHAARYPKILVLELAVDRPGDMRFFLSFVKPRIGILTAIAPVHLANFSKFSQLVAEKRYLLESLPKEGYAVVNYDDETSREAARKTKATVVPYGVALEGGAMRAQEVKVVKKDNALGLYFKLLYQDTVTPAFIKDVLAPHYMYSFLAAATVGMLYNLTPLEIVFGLEKFQVLPAHFVYREGIGKSFLIDDTYNAAPLSMCSALKSLTDLPLGGRKIAVLADMLELGSYEAQSHKDVGVCAGKLSLGMLVTYGARSKVTSVHAHLAGMKKKLIRHFEKQEELIEFLKKTIEEGDVIMVKGSRAMKMENVIEALKI